jgi:FkbM family methyltransferase
VLPKVEEFMVNTFFSKLRRRIRQILPLPVEAVCTMSGGYRMRLRPSQDAHERQLFFSGTYEPGTLALLDAVLRPGDVMVDVGANLGIMTLHAAKCVGPSGRVIALEPHPVYFNRLREHIEMNAISNIEPFNIAAGTFQETRAIFDVPSNIGRSSLISPDCDHVIGGAVKVQSLDDHLAATGVAEVRFLKIDVEGFEAEVVAGALKTIRRTSVISMECDPQLPTSGLDPFFALKAIMETGMYECFGFRDTKFCPSPLVKITDQGHWLSIKHENAIFIRSDLRATLPSEIFA